MQQKEKNERPEAYPKPSETDQQLKNQPEYIDQQPNSLEKDISDMPYTHEGQQSREKRDRDE